jgi:Flp pilus assembly secretin CpaC
VPPKERINSMNEQTTDQIKVDVLSYEVSDEAVETAGTRSEIAGAWTWVCTGIGCNYSPWRVGSTPN